MPPELHYELGNIDTSKVLFGKEDIRAINPQRETMEQLDGIVLLDTANQVIVGYKDVRDDEFWVRGHMPGYPLLPGVLMCEAAAQLCSFYIIKTGYSQAGDFMGFGGMENVRFRGTVHPGERLILVGKGTKFHRRQTVFNVQGFVNETMVFHGDIIGVPMRRKEG